MGRSISHFLSSEPKLATYWEMYELCRTKQLLITRMPADPQGKKEKIVVVEWPIGFSRLPKEGGVEDQSFLLMKVFSAFLLGEREGAFKRLSSK